MARVLILMTFLQKKITRNSTIEIDQILQHKFNFDSGIAEIFQSQNVIKINALAYGYCDFFM